MDESDIVRRANALKMAIVIGDTLVEAVEHAGPHGMRSSLLMLAVQKHFPSYGAHWHLWMLDVLREAGKVHVENHRVYAGPKGKDT